MSLRKIAASTGILLATMAASGSAQSEPLKAPSCYQVGSLSWSRPFAHSMHSDIPRRFVVDTVAGVEYLESNGHLLRPKIHQGRMAFAYWRALPPDSIALNWTSGFTGIRVRARMEGPTLHGRATAWIDAMSSEPLPTTEFRATRIPCDSLRPLR